MGRPELLPTEMILIGGEFDRCRCTEMHGEEYAKFLSKKHKKLVVYKRGYLLKEGLRQYDYKGLEDW